MTGLPVLYSFRRCPYAMRARLALWICEVSCELREVRLADKPPELLKISDKATVPVLALEDGTILQESLDIMRWALSRTDPEGWLAGDDAELIEQNDGPFKHHLDRYKYPNRYDSDPVEHRSAGLKILARWNDRLDVSAQLCGPERTMADMAIFPFVRQFAHTDRSWFDDQHLPRLQAWLDGHLASPIFASIMSKQPFWAAGDEPLVFNP